MRTKLLNYFLYQSGWLACVLGAAHDRPWTGMLVGLVMLGAHLALARRPLSEIGLVLASGLIGGTLDTVQDRLGVFTFTSGYVVSWICPPWIVLMWMQFATLLRYCLAWLAGRYLLSAGLGLIGGPLAFYAGERLGAVTLGPDRMVSAVALALVWSMATPVLVWLAGRGSEKQGIGSYRYPVADSG